MLFAWGWTDIVSHTYLVHIGGSGSTVAAAAVLQWWAAWRRRQQLGGSSLAAAWPRRQAAFSWLLFVFAPAIAVAAGVFLTTLFVTEFQNGKHHCLNCFLSIYSKLELFVVELSTFMVTLCHLLFCIVAKQYIQYFEQSIPFWNNMSYSTYIGIQYWKKCTHYESVQPTYIRNALIQA